MGRRIFLLFLGGTLSFLLAGYYTVGEAARRLRLGRSWYCELRTRALEGMLEALQAGVPGRPPEGRPSGEDPALRDAREEGRALRQELRKLQSLLELAQEDPDLLARQPGRPR